VDTEQKAWELLSMVDQIHEWGVTDFRDFVIQHLKRWHEFCKKCYDSDVDFTYRIPCSGPVDVNNQTVYMFPESLLRLAEWAKHLSEEHRKKLRLQLAFHLKEAMINYGADGGGYVPFICCGLGECGDGLAEGGYPLDSLEELLAHMREIHGESDADLTELARAWEQGGDPNDQVPIRLPFRRGNTTILADGRRPKRSYQGVLNPGEGSVFSKRRK
jgi:hypothetical protein